MNQIIKNNKSLELTNVEGYNDFAKACGNRKIETVFKIIYDKDFDRHRLSWLYKSLKENNIECIEFLFNKKYDTNYYEHIDLDKYNEFYEACKSKAQGQIKSLMPSSDMSKKIWLYFSINEENISVFRALVDSVSSIKDLAVLNSYDLFMDAIDRNDDAKVSILMPKSDLISRAWTYYAIERDHLNVFKQILTNGDRLSKFIDMEKYSEFFDQVKSKCQTNEAGKLIPKSEGARKLWLYYSIIQEKMDVVDALVSEDYTPLYAEFIHADEYGSFYELCIKKSYSECRNILAKIHIKLVLWFSYALNKEHICVMEVLLNRKINSKIYLLIDETKFRNFHEKCRKQNEKQCHSDIVDSISNLDFRVKKIWLHYALIENIVEVVQVFLNKSFNSDVLGLISPQNYNRFFNACKSKDDSLTGELQSLSETTKKIWLYHALNENHMVIVQTLLSRKSSC
jgi:hypothetical protein